MEPLGAFGSLGEPWGALRNFRAPQVSLRTLCNLRIGLEFQLDRQTEDIRTYRAASALLKSFALTNSPISVLYSGMALIKGFCHQQTIIDSQVAGAKGRNG